MMNQRLMQAYQQAPWRTQIQRIAIFMLVLITTGVIAGLYLSVSARAATAAIQIREFESTRDTLKEANSNLEAELAVVSSYENLKQRAQDLGYQPVDPYSIQYLVISEYPGRQPAMIAPPPSILRPAIPLLQTSYTQSLWDWLLENMTASGGNNG
jgi:cell division protein FtsL